MKKILLGILLLASFASCVSRRQYERQKFAAALIIIKYQSQLELLEAENSRLKKEINKQSVYKVKPYNGAFGDLERYFRELSDRINAENAQDLRNLRK